MFLAALPKLLASILLLTALGGALWLAGGERTVSAQTFWVNLGVDNDRDDNGLIEIYTIAQLNAIRWDLNGDGRLVTNAAGYRAAFSGSHIGMGCPGGFCYGYELRANLTSTAAWTPIHNYNAILDGNAHTISGINTGVGAGPAGLFTTLLAGSVVRNLGIISPTVAVNNTEGAAGGLAGQAQGRIYNSYVQGGAITISGTAGQGGGLVGYISASGRVESSWASAAVTVTGSPSGPRAGGLAGRIEGTIVASYSIGAVTGSGTLVRGLVGSAGAGTLTDSYCDATASGRSSDAQCRTTAQLQTPTGYTGIYENWNLDLDGNGAVDFPWDFGTSSTYPTLNSPARQLALSPLVDYDTDDNGLIEVGSLAQLDALRHDLDGNGVTASGAYAAAFPARSLDPGTRMGCPGGNCAGYELTANLTFPAETSSPYNPWTPIGGAFNATFDGRGNTLSELRIDRAGGDDVHAGLFRALGGSGVIRDVGLINPAVTSTTGVTNVAGHTGALVGDIDTGGRVTASYVSGGRIRVAGEQANVGGLAGQSRGIIRASYATAELVPDGAQDSVYAGGLVGWQMGGSITASYAAGAVPGAPSGTDSYFAGLVGQVSGGAAIAAGYCDRQVSMQTQANCVGRTGSGANTIDATATATAVMQAPTGYTGIYADWNIDLQDDFQVDFPWNFGGSSDYPTLNTPAQRTAAKPPRVDYDANDNGLIDVSSIVQLDAIRYDLNGDGAPTHLDYATAFPGRDTNAASRMGCPGGACAGYELMANLTFGASATWTPIDGEFSAVFDGRGRTVTDLKINVSGDDLNAGLFGQLSGEIRDVGLINPAVTSTPGSGNNGGYTGALVGYVNAGARIETSYVQNGRLYATGMEAVVGGLAGRSSGAISASYSTAVVASDTVSTFVYAGSLVGWMQGSGSTVTASYGAGLVTGGTGSDSYASGLVGAITSGASVAASYCDRQVTGKSSCVGETNGPGAISATAVTTAQLQAPTGYAGIYAAWNLDLDGDFGPDFPWNFGTSSTYPRLNTPAQRTALKPAPVDYDANDNGLIDISTTAQLDAIREDPNGNGDANNAAYAAAFPGRFTATTTRMGCPAGACAGYELTADLAFAATSTWAPVSTFNATLDGAGHSITGINVNIGASGGDAGMFGHLGASAVIRDLGLIDFHVTSTKSNGAGSNGILAGYVPNAVTIRGVYAQGGRIAVSTNAGGTNAGGLVGFCRSGCAITASYSTAAVSITAGTEANRHAGGVVARCENCRITASYAAGPVTSTVALSNIGGLTGSVANAASRITNSYCDTQTTGQSDCDGNAISGVAATGYTTAQLQAPLGYTGIYADWNVDLDGDGAGDWPWRFSYGKYPSHTPPERRRQLTAAAAAGADYDANDNGLIDVRTVDQLNAMRWDPDGDGTPTTTAVTAYDYAFPGRFTAATTTMGCPSGNCAGYELTADLAFATSSRWGPIAGFATTLDGAGHTITGVNINISSGDAGLFGGMTASATVRDLGLVDFSVTSTRSGAGSNGILAGFVNAAATISQVSVQGGRIAVSSDGFNTSVGGLVGLYAGSVTASYSTAAVSLTAGTTAGRHAGGLVGRCNGCAITASYAAGPVTTAATISNLGGLTGSVTSAGSITDSYCDTEGTGQSDCDGNVASGVAASAAGHTTEQMQTPTGYTGIYTHWNLDPDGNGHPNYPWKFGSTTTYPTLNTPDERILATPGPTDYDANNNNLIDVSTVAQLHAMRWDLDGDGDPDAAADALPYTTAFGGRTTSTPGRMGCPGTCAGYELMQDLTFDAGAAWDSIGGGTSTFETTFDGRGRTITGLNISVSGKNAGLFHWLGGSSTVRDLGLINPVVSPLSTNRSAGALAGRTAAGSLIYASYVQGGTTTVAAGLQYAGGLVGHHAGAIYASYSTAALVKAAVCTGCNTVRTGGLVGNLNGGEIVASYAAGPNNVTGGVSSHHGGFVGVVDGAAARITGSYCDATVRVVADCRAHRESAADDALTAVSGYTTAQMQMPTGYTGIYINWNVDLDDNGSSDFPWNFGTASDYPMLNTPAQRLAAAPPPVDYDVNNNNLIDIQSIAQLSAIRYDLDGDGDPARASRGAYNTAFPGRVVTVSGRMGCPATCAGYELTRSLSFPAETSSDYNPWTPIGGYLDTVFDGQGYTLSDLRVEFNDNAGLFAAIGGIGVVRNLGLIDAAVTSTAVTGRYAGALAGEVDTNGVVETSYVQGGRIAHTGGGSGNTAWVGGLIGGANRDSTIRSSYARTTVAATQSVSVRLGGLAGATDGAVVDSYAAGPVANTAAGNTRGGLLGYASPNGSVTNSYCDLAAGLQSGCIGSSSSFFTGAVAALTTAQLQNPTGYTGIYVHWNQDLDASGVPDYLWNFGSAGQYPTLNTPTQRAALIPAPKDYDANDNNLIDVSTLAQLYAIRWDTDGDGDPAAAAANAYSTAFGGRTTTTTGRMGCPGTCAGYELTRNMTFPAATTSAYNPWTPIAGYATTFDGQGHTLTSLNLSQSAAGGLFGDIAASGTIRDLGLINPAVLITGSGGENAGALAGSVSTGGNIETSYVDGGSVTVSGGSARAGGLVGQNNGRIRASYSTAAVSATGTPTGLRLGGLVGFGFGGQIIASYAAGPVSLGSGTSSNVGGLLGRSEGVSDTVSNSYCDRVITTQDDCVGAAEGFSTAAAAAVNTAALQTPAGYTGIYAHWNLDLDGDSVPDYPWNFRSASQHPALNTPRQRIDAAPAPMDYDDNDNNLIEVSNLDQLNAIRWDLNGDGDPESNAIAYSTVFPGRTATATGRMGCPATCAGYELTVSLTFPAETSSPYNPWTPVDQFAATFDGDGHTLTGMNAADSARAGLFGYLNSGGLIRDVGMINPTVTRTGDSSSGSGALVGYIRSGATVETSYATGGSVTIAGNSGSGGGLTGRNSGTIRASYANTPVRIDGARTSVALGGLAGRSAGTIVASYAAGAVTGSGSWLGGLVGRATGVNSAITNSYCDREAAGQTACLGSVGGSANVAAAAVNTAGLQAPAGYTGIYLNWNLDLDGDLSLDYPWNFGRASEYPSLYTPEQRAQQIPASRDYDDDDNNLIDIRTLDQLNAIRWDANGDGAPDPANFNAYGTVFPGRTATATGRMGCPDGCMGYELTTDLTFPAETFSPYRDWTPIATFSAEFDGKGHTLTDLYISDPDGDTGLFGQIGGPNGIIRNVGLINPIVSTTGANQNTGALAGVVAIGGGIDASYVSGGAVFVGGDNARAGGLAGLNRGRIRASYATANVEPLGNQAGVSIGGLVGYNWNAEIIASYAAGVMGASTGSAAYSGGLVGRSDGNSDTITNSYCDLVAARLASDACIGFNANNSPATATAYTTPELQQPAGYEGIYEHWNLDLDNDPQMTLDNPWQFARGSYPRLWHEGRAVTDSPPPGGPRVAQPPQDTPYNPASDHPEVYDNPRYEMSASCKVQNNADGEPVGSAITFDLGNYRGQVILHLAQWNGEYFTSYESLGIAMPTFERDGQTATVRVTTDPTQTRFLLDSISPTTNLVLGYADCHTDDATGVLVTPGAAAPTPPETAETPATSTPADADDPAETAETSTPPAPKIYTNDRYEMTASCDVRNNAEGEPESSLITFDLGRYEGRVILSISLWNGEYYASLESHDLTAPTLERNGQTATVLVTTNPAETRFLLDGTPNGLRTNLLLGYADCHTAGE